MEITRASLFALMLPVGVAVVAPGTTAAEPFATSGFLRVTKDCTGRSGEPGSFCTLTSSNISVIKAGSKVFYTQATGIPPGMLDSNVVLDAGEGNRALGRCTVAFDTLRGLCTFSDGTGDFAGFEARVDVSRDASGVWHWDGTYKFDHVGISWPGDAR